MKRLLFAVALLCAPAFGQGIIGNGLVQYVWTAPSGSCGQNSQMQIVVGAGTVYTCQLGTWTSVAGSGSGTVTSIATTAPLGGGTITTAGTLTCTTCTTATTPTAHGVILGAGTQALGVTAVGATGQVLTGNTGADPTWQAAGGGGPTYSQATTPTGPTVTDVGTPGVITWTYVVVGCQDTACTLHTAASAAGSDTNGNATLTSVNANNLSLYAVHLDGAQCYNIYRTVAGGTPSTTGKIASCVGQEYSDQGAAGDSSTAPVTNTTILASNPFPLPGCAIAVGGLVNVDAPPCSPTEYDDEFDETSGLVGVDPRWSWLNQNSATATLSNGLVVMTGPSRVGDNLNCLIQTAPSTPYSFTVKSYLNQDPNTASQIIYSGLAFYESATGKVLQFGSGASSYNNNSIFVNEWTTASSFSSTVLNNVSQPANPEYYRIQADGVNLNLYASPDGVKFQQVYTQAKAAFFTTAPNKFGICVDTHNGTGAIDFDYVRRTQ